jgi:hypothetical protein
MAMLMAGFLSRPLYSIKNRQAHARTALGLAIKGKNGPPAIPSLPVGPEVLFFSPKVEDEQK